MADSAILRSRIMAVLDEIDQARVAMGRIRDLAPTLHAGVAPRFDQALIAQQRRLTSLDTAFRTEADVTAGWNVLRQARTATSPVIREIHVFVQSAGARRDGLDRGVLRLADALLDELGGASEYKARMTVIADREFYGELAEMIRLRFPDTTIWVLPVIAHEFAHFLVRSLRVQAAGSYIYPLQELIQRARGATEQSRLEELVGDIFATYAIGPAYGLMGVALRFDVGERTPQDTHPSGSVRVEAIIRTLEAAPRTAYGHPYTALVAVLRDRWNAMRGTPEAATTENERADLALLDTHSRAILRTFEESLPQARYDTFREAEGLAPDLQTGAWIEAPNLRASIADILNAAWLARLASGERAQDVIRLESAARSLIDRRIAHGQTPVHGLDGPRP